MKIVDIESMKSIEAKAFGDFKIKEDIIIENVGIRVSDYILDTFLLEEHFGEIAILVGRGNNGADGLAVSRHLKNSGQNVRVFNLFPDDEKSLEFENQLELAKVYGVKITDLRNIDQLSSYFTQTQDKFLVIDAILGTGTRLPLSNYLFEIIQLANRHASILVSLDIPSGVTGDSGRISSSAIQADCTLAFGLPKLGHFIAPGAHFSGKLEVLEVGFPSALLSGGDLSLLTPQEVSDFLKVRDPFAYKNKFGHCLVLGGSFGLTGALSMASKAALKSGSGLVTAVTWEKSYSELCGKASPEIMTGVIPESEDPGEVEHILRDLEKYDTIVVGPGLGQGDRARSTVLQIVKNYPGPIVLDADAIRVLSLEEDEAIFKQSKAPILLTPHLGEFASFIGEHVDTVLESPLSYVRGLVDRLNCSLLLKGPCTFLGFPNGKVFLNFFPNDGMATGGSGDVLAGVLGGLLAQRYSVDQGASFFQDKEHFYKGVCLGVMVHSLAGKHARKEEGVRAMTALSILKNLSNSFLELENLQKLKDDF